jgi:hypothetical protein
MNSRVYAVVMISSLALCPGNSQGMEPVTLVGLLAATKAAAAWAAPYVVQAAPYALGAAQTWLISTALGSMMNSDRGPGIPKRPNGKQTHNSWGVQVHNGSPYPPIGAPAWLYIGQGPAPKK